MNHAKPTHDTRRQQMAYSKGPVKPLDPRGERKINQISDRLMRAATGGLCGFNHEGDVTLAVDPASARFTEVEV